MNQKRAGKPEVAGQTRTWRLSKKRNALLKIKYSFW